MRVGYVQTAPIFGDKKANFRQVEDLIGNDTSDLIVLPELFATGYAIISREEAQGLAENEKGETYEFLSKISSKTGAVIVAGFIEEEDKNIYNSAIMVSQSEVLGTYRKLHLYYKENLWFSPGNRKIKIIEVKDMKIGMMICFDWIFPEVIRSLALKGADIIAHPANLVMPFCQNAMITRCLENRVYAITANRIGEEIRGSDKFIFTGKSQITGYDGSVISSAPENKEHADYVDIDITLSRNKSLNEFNNLFEDRQPKLYRL